MDVDSRLNQLEQQLAAFEKLHIGELNDFEERLAVYIKLHADEVKMLGDALAELKREIEDHRSPLESASEK